MEIHEIRVTSLEGDPLGRDVLHEAKRTLGMTNFEAVRTARVYRLEGVTEEDARQLATSLFTDQITEDCAVDQAVNFGTRHVVEVAYKRGVSNPDAEPIKKAAADLGIHPDAVDSSQEFAFFGRIGESEVNAVVGRLLVNEKVQQLVVAPPETLTFEGKPGPINLVPIRSASERELMELSKDKLFLNSTEMVAIQAHFRQLERDPKDGELEHVSGASWSEHCGHKTFNAVIIFEHEDGRLEELLPLYTQLKDGSRAHPNFDRLVVSAFHDNSGVIRFYDGQAICGKVETHNSPSAIEPYGGAMTGSGGVFRDIAGTGQGAKTIISTDMFCFGPPDMRDEDLKPGTLPPDYLQRRVVQGVGDYSNRMGIPTPNGSVHYHRDFQAKPTVIVGAYGILPEARAEKGEPLIGDLVVSIGGQTGRDGIHGATFSSGEMTERTANVNASSVQIGIAIEEKRMFDALLEARDVDLIRAITDCGAAGFASAIGEIGSQIGVTVDISKAPLKYQGMSPWEIWISESQERMVAAISPGNIEKFMEICEKFNVEATVLGEFDGSQTLTVNFADQSLIELDYEFLDNGLPERTMYAKWERPNIPEVRPETPAGAAEWVNRFKAVLAHGNVCSKEPIVRQYDHGVQGGSVTVPYGGVTQEGPSDALVMRPMLNKPYGVVVSHGMNPILNRIDPYEGTKWAIAEAAANFVAVGGDINEAAAVGNYIWPSPDEDAMGSLVLSTRAVCDMMNAGMPPIISGKDSLSSTYTRRDDNGNIVDQVKIPPVYTSSIFGRIPDVEKTVTSDIKDPGNSTLYLIGKTSDGMGGSTYYDVTDGSSANLPKVDMEALPKTLEAVHDLIQSGRVLACHDVSEGGLATAVAEMCFGGDCGANIVINTGAAPDSAKDDPEAFLFSETAGCLVIEVPSNTDIYELLKGVPKKEIGYTTSDAEIIVQEGYWRTRKDLFRVAVDDLKRAWQQSLKEIFHG